jgi:hypothetical protein
VWTVRGDAKCMTCGGFWQVRTRLCVFLTRTKVTVRYLRDGLLYILLRPELMTNLAANGYLVMTAAISVATLISRPSPV